MKTIYTYLISLIFISPALAQTAGNWTFNNVTSGTPGAGISISSMTLGPGVPTGYYNGGTEYFGEGGWPSTPYPDPTAYLQWSLSPGTGRYLVLNNIKLVMRRSNTGTPSGSGPQMWSIRSSFDNFATDLVSGAQSENYGTYTVTLPSQYQGFYGSVVFRLYGFSTAVSSGGINRFVWDNISVAGQSISGVLAEQGISLAANSLAPGKVALQYNATGFDASADFTIQRSVNGSDFTPLYRQKALAAATTYKYEDQTAPAAGTIYYRVKGSNPDGSEYISPVVAVRQAAATDTKIRGILARGGSVQALLQLESAGAYQLNVWSQDGKAVARQAGNGAAGQSTVDVMLGSLPRGVYILTLVKDGERVSKQFVL